MACPFFLWHPRKSQLLYINSFPPKSRKRRKEIIAFLLSEDGKWYSPLGKPRCSMMPRGVWFCQVLAQENDIFSPWILVHLTVQFQRKETYFEQKKLWNIEVKIFAVNSVSNITMLKDRIRLHMVQGAGGCLKVIPFHHISQADLNS